MSASTRRPAPAHGAALLAGLALSLTGCHLLRPARPGPPPVAPGPPSPPPLLPPPPPPDDARGFEADFQGALSTLERGDPGNARLRFESLLQSPVAHALRATAGAILARLLLAQGRPEDLAAAEAVLDATATTPHDPAHELVRALARARGPRAAEVRPVLARLAETPPEALPALPGFSREATRLALLAAWAEAAAAARGHEEALGAWQRFFQAAASAGPVDQAYAFLRAEGEAAQLAATAALRLSESPEPFVRAAAAARAAAVLRERGKHDEARVHDEARAQYWRKLVPEPVAEASAPSPGHADPGRVGLLLPLSGSGLPLGLAVTRGGLVALALAPHPVLQLALRDSGAGAAAGAGELISDERSLGVVGVPDAQALALANRAGVPYLVLGDAVPAPGSTVWQLVHGPDARVRALVQAAAARGFRRFAILHADDDDGRAMRARFAAEVSRAGGETVIEQAFAPAATTFSKEAQALRARRFEALFVPASAARLELLAPALAVADLWPSPAAQVAPALAAADRARGDPRQPERRPILLLSTATGLSRELLRRAGRYVQGALLAPGFYADTESTPATGFASLFQELHGRAPGAGDAFGFDAVQVLRACVARGARTRAEVTAMLATDSFPGVTGTIRFGPDHLRADPARVYEVASDQIVALP